MGTFGKFGELGRASRTTQRFANYLYLAFNFVENVVEVYTIKREVLCHLRTQ